MKHFLKNSDLSVPETLQLIQRATEMTLEKSPNTIMRGKQMGSLFYEPSTRTRLSFLSAMNALGGSNIGFESSASASVTKGESLADTIKVVSQYTDIITLRHPDVSAPTIAAQFAEVPVINAGNGTELHPTQTLADLMTIYTYKNTLTGLNIVLAGDLKYGRTIHSLIRELLRFGTNQFTFVSHRDLKMPANLRELLQQKQIFFTEVSDFSEISGSPDIIYLTRVQTERFQHQLTPSTLNSYITHGTIPAAIVGRETLIMHPLPRGQELPVKFDSYRQSKYFDQVKFGKFIRMALIEHLVANNN